MSIQVWVNFDTLDEKSEKYLIIGIFVYMWLKSRPGLTKSTVSHPVK
jgi:hypothetical protein